MKFFLFVILVAVGSCSNSVEDERFFKFYVSFFELSALEGEEVAYDKMDSLLSYHKISSDEFINFRTEVVEYPEKWHKFLENTKAWVKGEITRLDSLEVYNVLKSKQKDSVTVIIINSDEYWNRKAINAYNRNKNLREYIQSNKGKEDGNYSSDRLKRQKSREVEAREKRRQNRIFRQSY